MALAPARSRSRSNRRFRTASLLLSVALIDGQTSSRAGAEPGIAKPGPTATTNWKLPADAWARPAVDGDSVFFLSRQHDVSAVNAATGAIRWSHRTGEPDAVIGAGITVAAGHVIAGDYNVTAFDRTTGAIRWRFAPVVGWAPGAYLGTAQNGVVFAGSGSGRVYAIDVLSGTPRWSASVVDDAPTTVYEPTVAGDLVVAAFTRNKAPTTGGVIALNAATGVEQWRAIFPVTAAAAAGFVSNGAIGSPVVFENLVIAANRDGVVYALRRADGSTAWTLPPVDVAPSWLVPANPGERAAQPPSARADARALARTNRTLFVGSTTGYLIAYDLDTRHEKWRYLAGNNYSLAPQLGADAQYVYVPSWSGRLAAVNVSNGTERWRIGDWKDSFLFPPAVSGNTVYATSSTGLHALRR